MARYVYSARVVGPPCISSKAITLPKMISMQKLSLCQAARRKKTVGKQGPHSHCCVPIGEMTLPALSGKTEQKQAGQRALPAPVPEIVLPPKPN